MRGSRAPRLAFRPLRELCRPSNGSPIPPSCSLSPLFFVDCVTDLIPPQDSLSHNITARLALSLGRRGRTQWRSVRGALRLRDSSNPLEFIIFFLQIVAVSVSEGERLARVQSSSFLKFIFSPSVSESSHYYTCFPLFSKLIFFLVFLLSGYSSGTESNRGRVGIGSD